MSEFVKMRDLLIQHFDEMTKDATHLFEVALDKDELWNTYLESFPEGTNEIYRERTLHDCSYCRQFIKAIGNVVVIKDNYITTLWDIKTESSTYQPVMDAMAAFVKKHAIKDVFLYWDNKVGCLQNFEHLEDGTINKYEHFYLELPTKFVNKTSRSLGDIQGDYRDVRNVFKRSLDEISQDALETVLELINSNTLYKGAEWKSVLTEFLKHKKEYMKLQSETEKALYAWEKSVKVGIAMGKIRNHSIGTLLVNISEGMDLELAVKKYEQIVAPANYKRPKAIFTQKMLDAAQKTITDLGYLESLPRRHAKMDDISINNILFANKDAAKKMNRATDIFGEMAKEATSNPKKFSKVEEVSAEKFINDILPSARELEVYLENRHAANMVSLIAPQNVDSKTMFKWDNNFGWAYSGNMTDSMKERVKAAGGKVDGDLRFSIQWNESGKDGSDVDAHCKEPNGNEIYYGEKVSRFTKGNLDVDIRHPGNKVAVENITWASRTTMKDGVYKFFVEQFEARGVNDGFRAEIEFDGQVYSFEYNKPMRTDERIQVAEVTLSNGVFTIKEMIPSSVSSKEVWGLKTNQFVPVSTVCYSPNYWNQQKGIGHQHLFFMLNGCINPENPNGMFNEYLNHELYEHRKVMEALGAKLKVANSDEQLSGVGFSMTKRADIVVRVKGATERIFRVKF